MNSAGKNYTPGSSYLVQNTNEFLQTHHLQNHGGGFVSSSPLYQDIQATIAAAGATTSSAGSSSGTAAEQTSCYNAILYNLSVLKEEINQLHSLVNVATILPHYHHLQQLHLLEQPHDDQSVAISAMGTQIQKIIVTASSMMYTIQKYSTLSTYANSPPNINMGNHGHQFQQVSHNDHDHIGLAPSQLSGHNDHHNNVHVGSENGGRGSLFVPYNEYTPHDNYVDSIHHRHNNSTGIRNTIAINNHKNINGKMVGGMELLLHEHQKEEVLDDFSQGDCKIIELEAAILLAKYTHYCQLCGKGFKREANLRMHMRAHGDEYKSTAALSNPMKDISSSSKNGSNSESIPRKYSCPHEGCRWNKKHPKFQPLKSMICVKNHYKRSHCPKMYVCNRCNQKQFSVLSDLRTHEKHCGELKWLCSCGSTFSRKDKLMGHCSLFFGHTPSGTTLITRQPENFDLHTEQMLY